MDILPNLAGVATQNLVETIGGGTFKASYINWARTVQLLREHAPGWMPEVVPADGGGVLHRAPQGGYLLIRFRHLDGTTTPEVPQAVMDTRNAAITYDKITARDITDTQRRGVCMAAAFTFGLAFELWAKMPLESGFAEAAQPEAEKSNVKSLPAGKPTDGAWEAMNEEEQVYLQGIAKQAADLLASGDAEAAHDYIQSQNLDSDEKIALWTRLDSKQRSALKRADAAAKAKTTEQAA
jgi:hypothetical protein